MVEMDLRLLWLTDGYGIAADGALSSMGGISVPKRGLQMLKDLVSPTHAIKELLVKAKRGLQKNRRRGHWKNKRKKGNWKQQIRGLAEHPR